MTDSGFDELRCAIIKQALNDVETYILWSEFVTDKMLDKLRIPEKVKIQILSNRCDIKRWASDAYDFLGSSWCQCLAGRLDVPSLVTQNRINAEAKKKILKSPVVLYIGTEKRHDQGKRYKTLYGMQIKMMPQTVSPTFFLTKIKEEGNKKIIEFSHNYEQYYIEFGRKK